MLIEVSFGNLVQKASFVGTSILPCGTLGDNVAHCEKKQTSTYAWYICTLACIVAIGWWLWFDCYAHLHALLMYDDDYGMIVMHICMHCCYRMMIMLWLFCMCMGYIGCMVACTLAWYCWKFILIKMMVVMIVMHVHEMSRWYDDMVVCVNATSIYVS